MNGDAVDVARHTSVLEYSSVACCAFLAWEACVTLAEEANFLWSRPRFRWTKIAYVLLRYYAFVVVIMNAVTLNEGVCRALRLCGPSYCMRWYIYSTSSFQVVAALQQFIMASRVYALYGRSPRIYRTLFWAFIVEHVTMVIFTVVTASTVWWFGPCAPRRVSDLCLGIGIPALLYDALLLALTVRECTRGRWRHAALPALLLRDGTWAFTLVFSMYGVQGIFFLALSGPLASVAWPWQCAASSLAACRLVLRMHSEGAACDVDNFSLTTFGPGLTPDESTSQW